jgi:hypothetical protein
MIGNSLSEATSAPDPRAFIRVERCRYCRREFRGIYPRPVRVRHEAEHRYAAIAKVATSR